MAQTAQQFWDDLPQITKYLCVFILGLTMIAQFGLVSGYSLILDFDLIFNLKQLQLWRLITGVFFYGGFSFSFLMNFLVLYVCCVAYYCLLDDLRSMENSFFTNYTFVTCVCVFF